MRAVRIATRRSPLALWQAKHVRERLLAADAGLDIELVPVVTDGDRWAGGPLGPLGGKGLFVDALEHALRASRADLAVHSMKDVPAALADGCVLGAVLPGADPCDALVGAVDLDALPKGARVGTASLRRQALLRSSRPDLEVVDLRGNVGTRLQRLDAGDFDAILLACAGLVRLGEQARIGQRLPVQQFVPAPGQGVIGIECRAADAGLRARLATLEDADTRSRITAERRLNADLGGSCRLPLGALAVVDGAALTLDAVVLSTDGRRRLQESMAGLASDPAGAGSRLAGRLRECGAAELLAAAAS